MSLERCPKCQNPMIIEFIDKDEIDTCIRCHTYWVEEKGTEHGVHDRIINCLGNSDVECLNSLFNQLDTVLHQKQERKLSLVTRIRTVLGAPSPHIADY